jgi:hypothetical protein
MEAATDGDLTGWTVVRTACNASAYMATYPLEIWTIR